METVLTLTPNPAIDASTAVDRVIGEQKLRCRSPRFDPGGGGINVARVIHRLGGEATALFFSGGPTGELLQLLLEREGVASRAIRCEQWTRENFTVLEESSGRQFRFGMPGAEVTRDEWERMLALLREWEPAPRFIVASGSLPPGVAPDGFAQVARISRERGIRFVLDTSGSALVNGVTPGVFLVKPNLSELAELAGVKLANEEEVKAVARSIINHGSSEVVVVSLGAGGAYLLTATECERIVSPIVPVRSGVGAGDSMVAAIVFALVRGRSIREAVQFGAAAGAAAVTQPGTELCHVEDVERLFSACRGAASEEVVAAAARPQASRLLAHQQ